ncbi:unnamed protein product [Merluccius merluccius]
MVNATQPVTQNHVWVDVTRHNSNLPPLAVKNPECLGLLYEIDKNKDMSRQLYCILKDGCLYFYNNIRSTHALGGMYLHGYMVREQLMGSKKSTIELKPPSDEFKTHYLSAENPNENKRWIEAMKVSINKWQPLHWEMQSYTNQAPEETKIEQVVAVSRGRYEDVRKAVLDWRSRSPNDQRQLLPQAKLGENRPIALSRRILDATTRWLQTGESIAQQVVEWVAAEQWWQGG